MEERERTCQLLVDGCSIDERVICDCSNIHEVVVMKKFIIMFSIMFIFISIPVYAGFFSGNDLLEIMREWENAESSNPKTKLQDATEFRGYVVGVFDILDGSGTICTGDNVNKRQVGAVVVKYLNDNPARWSDPAYILVTEALKKAFPCKK
jgi:hypothetical protein